MKRHVAALALLALCLLPATAMASSISWSTPWTTGSLSSDGSSSASTSGNVAVDSTNVDWSLDLGTSSLSGSISALINGQSYSGSFDLSDLFNWLFW